MEEEAPHRRAPESPAPVALGHCFSHQAGGLLELVLEGEFVLITLWFDFLFFHPYFGRIDLAVIALISFPPRFDEDIEVHWSLGGPHRCGLNDEIVPPGHADDRSVPLVLIYIVHGKAIFQCERGDSSDMAGYSSCGASADDTNDRNARKK
jgi:hypothetical protein